MPRLNRPNCDPERVRALRTAKMKVETPSSIPNPVSSGTVSHLHAFLPMFENAMQSRGSALAAQSKLITSLRPERAALKRYIKHFIKVFNLGIGRDLFRASDRGYYQLEVEDSKLPPLRTDDALVMWADNIISGEEIRVLAGGAPMAMPSAAEVEAKLNGLTPLLDTLTTLKDNYDNKQEDVQEMRPEADDLISDIWDEVLFAFRKDSAASLRRKAREYGVVYRPNAVKKKV